MTSPVRMSNANAGLSDPTGPGVRSVRERRIRRLIDALQSLDDRDLSQIGIERREIARFARAEVVLDRRERRGPVNPATAPCRRRGRSRAIDTTSKRMP